MSKQQNCYAKPTKNGDMAMSWLRLRVYHCRVFVPVFHYMSTYVYIYIYVSLMGCSWYKTNCHADLTET